MPVILFICYILFTTTGMLLIKIGGAETSAQITLKLISVQLSPILILGLVCYLTSFALFIILVQKVNLSLIVPISTGITNLTAVLLGTFVLKRKTPCPQHDRHSARADWRVSRYNESIKVT